MKSIRMIGTAVIALGLATSASAQEGDPISDSAAIYGTYQSEVTEVKEKPFSSAGDIDNALTSLGGHNPDQLSKGWIAYSALIASQDPEYRAAVRDIEGFYGRDALLTGLQNDVRYARQLSGGDNAVSSALSATEADSQRITSAAAYVKEQAYSLQASGWAKAKIGNSGAKATKLNSQQTIGTPANAKLVNAFKATDIDSILAQAGRSGAPSLWDNVSGAAEAIRFPAAVTSGLNLNSKKRVKFGKEPVADQIATLAAYRVLGTTAASSSQVHSAMAERETRGCLNMANLNLQQCVAAANQQYEVPFCIGEHALADVGQCIGGVYQ
ncbi:hypothetical protein [Hyphomonas pacifica]|uniref:Uncharacterized protein n=1 Tax=Hyphomonas pacifica TaxID=1280941 RepID=A0A062TV51_9PROT|nr:hypothetical protein [Hyphomonas pacifica]KCZ46793.1 hypothetical protein HY2_05230 [Hyphomonas pacifica]MBR9808914.1 hypothetical protein [Alphaproteobacteria bacterium]RAN30409.1 hypothetical protein HY3_06200 [Hyphomonas pacifica]RAN31797.1 hypothetical protein HY11_06300 [Hyphomonas pacifica]